MGVLKLIPYRNTFVSRGLSVAKSAILHSIMGVQKDWFLAEFKKRDWSLRDVASKLEGRRGEPMHAPSLFRILNGEKEATAFEAYQLSKILNVPLSEIVKRLGLPARWLKWERR